MDVSGVELAVGGARTQGGFFLCAGLLN
jgi:hypothetical protein